MRLISVCFAAFATSSIVMGCQDSDEAGAVDSGTANASPALDSGRRSDASMRPVDAATGDTAASLADASLSKPQSDTGPRVDAAGLADTGPLVDAAGQADTGPLVDAAGLADAGLAAEGWPQEAVGRGAATGVAAASDGTIHVTSTRRLSDAMTLSFHLIYDASGRSQSITQLPDGGGGREKTSTSAVTLDAAGNAYMGGTYRGLDPSGGFVRRRDADLTWGWIDKWNANVAALTTDNQDRIVAVGRLPTGTDGGFRDPVFVRRYLPGGSMDLDRKVPALHEHTADAVITDVTNNIYIAGLARVLVGEFPVGVSSYAFFSRLGPDGEHKYTKYIEAPNCPERYWASASAIAIDSAGDLWVGGLDCNDGVFLRKFEPATGALLLNADASVVPGLLSAAGDSVRGLASTSDQVFLGGEWTGLGADVSSRAVSGVSLNGTPTFAWMDKENIGKLTGLTAFDGTPVVVGGRITRATVQRLLMP